MFLQDGVDYYAFGDYAYKKNTLTNLEIYGKNNEFYSLESLVVFLKYSQDSHGFYVKEAAAANVRAVTRIDRLFLCVLSKINPVSSSEKM